MNKKTIFLAIIPFLAAGCSGQGTPTSSSSEPVPETYNDRDFDGLYDEIDPTPDDNRTGFVCDDHNTGVKSNEVFLHVDYRNIVYDDAPTYNRDFAQVCAMIANFSYDDIAPDWSVTTSKYENEESAVNRVLVQFGFKDVEHVLTEDFADNPYDVCNSYFGNHIFVNNGKKYQIFVDSICGYPTAKSWYSNFDIGYDDDSYYIIKGKQPEWQDKKIHKGFYITAKRNYKMLEEYMESVKDDSVDDTIVIVTGHSRGGAISNLLGKFLKDNSVKSVVYAFNGCRVTTEDNKEILDSYTNIFNVDSIYDYVSSFPFKHMGFNKFGTTYSHDLAANNQYFKSIYNLDYKCTSVENIKAIDDLAEIVMPSREGFYKYPDIDPKIDEFKLCETRDEAEEVQQDLNDNIDELELRNQVKCEILDNLDDDTKGEYPFKVQYYAKQSALFDVAANIICISSSGAETKFIDILNVLVKASTLLSRMIEIMLTEGHIDIDVLGLATPHMQTTCIAGAYVAGIIN